MLEPQQSVADVVLDHSECAEVFQRHRIDFCCRGHLSLAAAASEKTVAVAALVAELERHHIERVLARCGGSPSEAARILGVARNTLWRKLRAWAPAR